MTTQELAAGNDLRVKQLALAQLVGIEWDAGNAYFPATSFQISNIHAGTGVGNVIPGECVVDFNFRYCTESTPLGLQQRLEAVLQEHGLEYKIDWTISGPSLANLSWRLGSRSNC